MGKNVPKNKFPIGSDVAIEPQEICKKCYNCKKKKYTNFCHGTIGLGFDGGLSQYVRCHFSVCFLYNSNKIPHKLSNIN